MKIYIRTKKLFKIFTSKGGIENTSIFKFYFSLVPIPLKGTYDVPLVRRSFNCGFDASNANPINDYRTVFACYRKFLTYEGSYSGSLMK